MLYFAEIIFYQGRKSFGRSFYISITALQFPNFQNFLKVNQCKFSSKICLSLSLSFSSSFVLQKVFFEDYKHLHSKNFLFISFLLILCIFKFCRPSKERKWEEKQNNNNNRTILAAYCVCLSYKTYSKEYNYFSLIALK